MHGLKGILPEKKEKQREKGGVNRLYKKQACRAPEIVYCAPAFGDYFGHGRKVIVE